MKIGRYEVIRKLAAGGMAEVFLAKVAGPLGFEKTVVVKRILPHLLDEPSFVEMFLAEAKLVAQLNHPHIVQLFDFGEADGAYFVAMEYIDGPNLRTLVRRASELETFLPSSLCAKMTAAAAEGLAYAHDFREPTTQQPLSLIHRDISPDNILLSRQGAVKVADFGIAKVTGHGPQTQEGILKGKLPYMSPEQLRGQPLDRRADVYALGLVLYELLTSHKPFAVTAEEGILNAILFEPFIPAQQRRPGLPDVIQQILDRALAKDRNDRYADCLALRADLERFVLMRGEPLSALHIARLITQFDVAGATGTTPVPRKEPPPVFPLSEAQASKPVVRGPPRPREASTTLHETRVFEEKLLSRGSKQVAVSTLTALLTVSGSGYLLWRGCATSAAEPSNARLSLGAESGSSAVQPLPSIEDAASEENHEPAPAPQQVPLPLPVEAEAGHPAPSPLPEPDARPASRPPLKPASFRSKASRSPTQRSTPGVQGKARIDFRVLPYAMVFLDGKELGTTPFAPIEISPGRHSVRLLNPEFSKAETRSIDVKAGEVFVLKHNFDEN